MPQVLGPRGGAAKCILCPYCSQPTEVALRAMSIFCPHCRKRVILEDYKITSYYAVREFFTNRLDTGAHPYYERLVGVRVSAHFFVRRDGAVIQFVSCDQRAWHAGASRWNGRDECNDWSIGIELEGLEGEGFERAQYRALLRLLRALARRYPMAEVVGHEHVAPGRKQDPGARFRWRWLARRLGTRWKTAAAA